jgi:hypothetical protein
LMITVTITDVSKSYILKACSSIVRPLMKDEITWGSSNQ